MAYTFPSNFWPPTKSLSLKFLGHLSILKTILILVSETVKNQEILNNWSLEKGGTSSKYAWSNGYMTTMRKTKRWCTSRYIIVIHNLYQSILYEDGWHACFKIIYFFFKTLMVLKHNIKNYFQQFTKTLSICL